MLKAPQHFLLCIVAPPVVAALVCYGVYLCQFWMRLADGMLMAVLFGVFILVMWLVRRAVRSLVPVQCPYCRGRAYEIEERGNRFMCLSCGRDH
jgi:hypothetical protein